MIPEETDPIRPTPEEPLTPTLLPDPAKQEPAEPLDDGGFTPPHGDPLGEAALDLPDVSASPLETAGLPDHEVQQSSPFDSTPRPAFTADTPQETEPGPPELVYAAPVEPAPAGASIAGFEPTIGSDELPPAAFEEEVVTLQTGWQPTQAETGAESEVPTPITGEDQPEQLYAGPVEPAPAGLYLTGDTGDSSGSEEAVSAGEPRSFPDAEPHDDLEAAALASEAAADGPPEAAPEELADSGPNWMLAFICAWSSAISLREAWATIGGGGLGMALRNLGVMGYLLLGVGLLAFAFDALRWGRPRRGVGALVIPTLLTLAGVVCLVLWNDRGRPI